MIDYTLRVRASKKYRRRGQIRKPVVELLSQSTLLSSEQCRQTVSVCVVLGLSYTNGKLPPVWSLYGSHTVVS